MEETIRHIDYRGLPVAIRTIGNGKPLLMLHGWGTGSKVLSPLALLLADLRTCHLVDLPGFGDTPEPPDAWSIDDYAGLTEAVIRELGADSTDLLAHSFGGRITLKLLARDGVRDKIGKVLITGGAGIKPKRTLSWYGKTLLSRTLKTPLKWLPGPLGERALRALRKTSLWKWLGSSDYQNLSEVMRGTFVRSVTEHLDSCLPDIRHEVLLLWGKEDTATPLYQAERMERGLENGVLVTMDHAGHYAFLDKPKQFASIVRAYLK